MQHRRLLIDFVNDLPEDIRRQALTHRTKDWAHMHFYSMRNALIRLKYLVDNPSEKDFWDNVYQHYKHGHPMPLVSDIEACENVIYRGSRMNFDGMSKLRCVRTAIKEMTGTFTAQSIHRWLVDRGANISQHQVSTSLSKLKWEGKIHKDGYRVQGKARHNLYYAK